MSFGLWRWTGALFWRVVSPGLLEGCFRDGETLDGFLEGVARRAGQKGIETGEIGPPALA